MVKIGFIGFGEAAFNISIGLRDEGVSGIVAYDTMADQKPMRELIERRAVEAQVKLLPSPEDVARYADVVIISVPSSYTIDACRSIVNSLSRGQIYVDVSASTPEIKKQEWELIKDKGVLFSDSAMLGSLPLSRHKVPIIASGNGAQAFHDALTPYGMKIEVVSETPGVASAIKLVRSIFMKGLAALLFEMLDGAEAHNVSEYVINSIGTSLDGIPFKDHLNRLVSSTAIHAHRRAAELEGAIKMLEEANLCSVMTAAARKRHMMLERYEFDKLFIDRQPSDWKEIFSIIKNYDKN